MSEKTEREAAILEAIAIAESYARHPGIDRVDDGVRLAGTGMVERLKRLLED